MQPCEKTSRVSIAEINLLQNDDFTVRMALKARFGESAQRLLNGYQDAWIKAEDLDNIKSWGMNAVRVPINWLDFMDVDGAWLDSGWARLDWVIEECGKRRIYVILDMHAVPGGASPWASSGHAGDDGNGQNPNGFWTNPRFQDLTAEIWARIAARYKGRAAVAGYDLINEPLYCYDEAPVPGQAYSEAALKKAALFDRIYRKIRSVDPDHMIFIAAYTVARPNNTAYIGTPSGFWGITPPSYHGWQNVVYETHHYDMPNAKVRGAQERLISDALKDLTKHQLEWNIPIFAGEYSLYNYYDVWAKWMTGLNRLNISWTNWTYKVRGTADDEAGINWGFFHSNRSEVPNINADSEEVIARKWKAFETSHFVRNDDLISVVSRYTSGATIDPTN